MHPIYAYGTAEQKEKYLPLLGEPSLFVGDDSPAHCISLIAKGKIIGCFVRPLLSFPHLATRRSCLTGPNRAQSWLRPSRHGDHRNGGRWRLRYQRCEDMDHQRTRRVSP